MGIGRRLRQARAAAKRSFASVDEAAGITPGHTRAIEVESIPDPRLSTSKAIAHALNVSLDWLAGDIEPRTSEE